MRKRFWWALCAVALGCGGKHAQGSGGSGGAGGQAPAALWESPTVFTDVKTQDLTLHDAARNRDVPVKIRLSPSAPQPLKVIILAHGGDANPTGQNVLNEWNQRLAERGFAAINVGFPPPENGPAAVCAALAIPATECEAGDFTMDPADGGTLPTTWWDRPHDVGFVIDQLPTLAMMGKVQLDLDRIGGLGHSGGSHCMALIDGAVVDWSPSVQDVSLSDPRIKYVVLNSPQGVGRLGLTDHSWDTITRPTLVQTGAGDSTSSEEAASRLDVFMHLEGPEAYQMYIDSPDAVHGTFQLTEPLDSTSGLELYVLHTALAFFDAYERDVPGAKSWLTSGQIDTVSSGIATITAK